MLFLKIKDGETITLGISSNLDFASGERLSLFPCMEDSTLNVQAQYFTEFRTILLNQISFNIDTEFTSISLLLSSVLYLEDPDDGLVGDFITLTGFGNQGNFGVLNIMDAPIDIRTFPVPIEEMESFEFIEERTLNGITYNDIFVSNETSEASFKVYMTIADGIVRIEESDGVVWDLIGFE